MTLNGLSDSSKFWIGDFETWLNDRVDKDDYNNMGG
jgi:hypothetical protein